MADQIEYLRRKRGSERVTFADIADHLHDFADRRPDYRGTVQQLAAFLADVEDVDHDHEAAETRGLT